MKNDYLIIGYRDWIHAESDGINVRDLQIASRLPKSRYVDKVLFVNRPVSLAELILRKYKWRHSEGETIISTNWMHLTKISHLGEFYVLSIFCLDIFRPLIEKRLWWDTAFKKESTLEIIRHAKKIIQLKDDILLLWTPFAPSVVDGIDHKIFAHDIIDNFTKHNRVSTKEKIAAKIGYEKIDRKADLISSVSSIALSSFTTCASKITIPNGVNESWLSLSPSRPSDLPTDKKIVGFGGYISDKLDIATLIELALMRPEIQFVILGAAYDKSMIQRMKKVDNILYLGFKRFDTIPEYYYHFDVGLIIYHPNKSHDGDPLKLYEYLSVGTPVASLPIDGIEGKYGKYAVIGKNATELSYQIDGFLKTDRAALRESCRQQLNNNNFWIHKSNALATAINNLSKTET